MNTYILDGRKLYDKKSVHTYIAGLLQFPKWYGNNLDALHDSLCEIGTDTTVCFINTDTARKALNEYFDALTEVFNDCSAENPHLTVKYDSL